MMDEVGTEPPSDLGVSSTDPVSTTITSSTIPASDSRQPPRNSASSLAIRTAESRADELPLTGVAVPAEGGRVLPVLVGRRVELRGLVLPVLVGRRARLLRLVLPVLVGRRLLLQGLVLPVLVGRRVLLGGLVLPVLVGRRDGLPCWSGPSAEAALSRTNEPITGAAKAKTAIRLRNARRPSGPSDRTMSSSPSIMASLCGAESLAS